MGRRAKLRFDKKGTIMSGTEAEKDKLGGADLQQQGLRILVRIIAQAYIRDTEPSEKDSHQPNDEIPSQATQKRSMAPGDMSGVGKKAMLRPATIQRDSSPLSPAGSP